MRRVLFILATAVSLALAATLFLWVHAQHTPDYFEIRTDYHTPPGTDEGGGLRSYGLYADHGRVGLLCHSASDGFIDLDKLAGLPQQPSHLLWDHSDCPDPTYIGALSPDELGYYTSFSRFGISLYGHAEGGMSHSESVQGGLVDAWLLATSLAVVLSLILWRLARPHGKVKAGLCPTCSYDIRTQLLGEGGRVCPECGTPVKTDSEC
jgi:hypothetical protein